MSDTVRIQVSELCTIFIKSRFDSRIEFLLELPKGKFTAGFEASDIIRAKEKLGDHCCISGNIPASLLQAGTPDDIITYCKKLIETVAVESGSCRYCFRR